MNANTRHRILELARNAVQDVAGPPVPVERIVREHGIRIAFEPFDDRISGLACTRNGVGIIGVNCAHTYTRQRFTIAHEWGHLLLHQIDVARVENDEVIVGFRQTGVALPPEESEANLFAEELMMPDRFMKRDLIVAETMVLSEAIRYLADRYTVSEQAMSVRFRNYVDFLPLERRRDQS